MVFGAVDCERGARSIAKDGGEVRVELFLDFGCQVAAAVFGAEDEVDNDGGEGLSHGGSAPFQGLREEGNGGLNQGRRSPSLRSAHLALAVAGGPVGAPQ